MEKFKLIELLKYVVTITMSIGKMDLSKEDYTQANKNYSTALELIATLLLLRDYDDSNIETQIEKANEFFANVNFEYKNKLNTGEDLALCILHLLLATEYNLGIAAKLNEQ